MTKIRETNSSGYSTDALNTREDRLRADPALEPELARKSEMLTSFGADLKLTDENEAVTRK